MGLPAQKVQPLPAKPAGEVKRRIKKGETIFSEGDTSRAMYLVKSGMVRIFKKKTNSFIELDTIRSGQVLGELAFLDGNPRSASAEALTDCELIEIGTGAFAATLTALPEWVKILLKTVVGRLRTAGTRIRQLESASSAVSYDNEGGRSASYAFLSISEFMRVGTGVLLVGVKHGAQIKMNWLNRYVTEVLQVPEAKLTAALDVLSQVGAIRSEMDGNSCTYTLLDAAFLEKIITYLNEENLCEPKKRHDLNLKGFKVMTFMAKHFSLFPIDPATKMAKVNLAEIRKMETPEGGKEPFQYDEFADLERLGYASTLQMKSAEEALTDIDPEAFMNAYKLQRVVKSIEVLNEQKRKSR